MTCTLRTVFGEAGFCLLALTRRVVIALQQRSMNLAEEQILERAIREIDSGIRHFVDRSGLETGVDWQ